MGDACPWTPTAVFGAGLLQRGGTCGQASPVGVLTTQDRPCPVHQSSEASHPSPTAAPQAHRAQAGLIWPHSGVGWRAAAQVGLMPQYPPTCPAGDWLARLRVGAAQAWPGWQCPGWCRHSGHAQRGSHPQGRQLDLRLLFHLLGLSHPLTCLSSGHLAREAREATGLTWPPAGAWSGGAGSSGPRTAVGSRACLGTERSPRGYTPLGALWLRPWAA